MNLLGHNISIKYKGLRATDQDYFDIIWNDGQLITLNYKYIGKCVVQYFKFDLLLKILPINT